MCVELCIEGRGRDKQTNRYCIIITYHSKRNVTSSVCNVAEDQSACCVFWFQIRSLVSTDIGLQSLQIVVSHNKKEITLEAQRGSSTKRDLNSVGRIFDRASGIRKAERRHKCSWPWQLRNDYIHSSKQREDAMAKPTLWMWQLN